MTDLTDIRCRMHDLTIDYARREREDPEQWTTLFDELSVEARLVGCPEQEVVDFEAYERKHIIVAPPASSFRAWQQPYKG